VSSGYKNKVQARPAQNFTPVQTNLLQRKCTLCNKSGLLKDSEQDKEKLTLQRSSVDLAGTTTVPRFGHDFSRVSVHSTGPGMIQTKLTINKPRDIYEQEADRVAEQVMATRAHPGFPDAPPRIQRYMGPPTGQADTARASVDRVLASHGTPLGPAIQQDMEQRFGHDFSRVRVHTDAQAEESTRALSARAFTIGRDVVFGSGHYAPGTVAGKRLIAHELTHVIQQNSSNHQQFPFYPPPHFFDLTY